MWNSLLRWHRYLSPWAWLLIVWVCCHGSGPATPIAQLRPDNCTLLTASCCQFNWDQTPNPSCWPMRTNSWMSTKADNAIRRRKQIYLLLCSGLQLLKSNTLSCPSIALVMRLMSTAAHTNVARFLIKILWLKNVGFQFEWSDFWFTSCQQIPALLYQKNNILKFYNKLIFGRCFCQCVTVLQESYIAPCNRYGVYHCGRPIDSVTYTGHTCYLKPIFKKKSHNDL